MRRLSTLLLCIWAAPAGALTLRACVFDRPFPPLTMPDGSGQVQELWRRAARTSPIVLHTVLAARADCLAQLQSGEVDAVLGAFLPERQAYAAYPMAGQQPDQSQALGTARFMVYRRRGGTLGWDGHQFSGLGRQPVGILPAFLYAPQLRQMGVVTDEDSRSVEDNFDKLVQNRVAAVVALEGEAQAAIAHKYRDDIEVLPQPFQTTLVYLLVNRAYYGQHQAQVDAYWLSLRQYRLSGDYQQYLSHPR